MECDNSDSGSVQGLRIGFDQKFGVGSDVECVAEKPRVEKMDGEEKSACKKRLSGIGVGLDSDDDEPIGSLFKLKSKRKSKKVKVGLDGGGDKRKHVEVRREKLLVEDFGGMNDTLASFRKKLKGPKKDTGSGLIVRRNLATDVAEPSGELSNGPVKDGDLAAKSVSKIVEKEQMTSDYVSDGFVDKEFEHRPKGKSKRSQISLLPKKNGGDIELDDVLNGQRSSGQLLKSEKGCILGSGGGSNHSLDENLEDSLSAFFRKAQSGLIRRSRSSLRPKQVKGTEASNDELSPSSGGVSEELLPVVVSRSRSASKLVKKIPGSDENLHQVSGIGSVYSTCDQNKIGIRQNSDDTLSHVSNCIRGNTFSGEPSQVLSSTEVVADEILRSGENIHKVFSDANLEDSVPISLLQRSQFCLSECSNKTTRLQDGEGKWKTSGIQEGLTLDPLGANHLLAKNPKDFLSVNVKESGSLPSQGPTLGIQSFSGELNNPPMRKARDLVRDVVQIPNSIFAPEKMQTIHRFDEGVPTGGFGDGLEQLYKGVVASHTSSTDQKICSSFGKDVHGPCFSEFLEPSASPSHKSVACNEKMGVAGLNFGQCLKDRHSQFPSSSSAFGSPHCNSPNRIPGTCIEEPDIASVSSQMEDASASDSRLSPVSQHGVHKFEVSFLMNHPEKSLETGDDPSNFSKQLTLNDSVTSLQKCSSTFLQNQLSDDVCKGVHIPSRDFSCDEEANAASSPSTMPDQNESCADDTGSVPDPESKDNKPSAGQRVMRKTKKYKHGDMAYEGDADWEILIHEQDFKFNSSSTMVLEAEIGGAAAVSAGLKARAAGPVEKIKFKEVLKRKGGLQEYLECRNHILALWNKDVSRILPLSDCGVSDTPLTDEPPRVSLVRDIYIFLDHCGYINIGVASEKEVAETVGKPSSKLLEERNFGEKSGPVIADSDDGVSFILGGVKNLEMEKNFDDESRAAKAKTDNRLLNLPVLEFSATMELERCPADDYLGNGDIDAKLPSRMVHLDLWSSIPLNEVGNDGTAPVVTPELPKQSFGVQSASIDPKEGNHHMQSDSEVGKRIIVIGAGPAGLTAARHLQRQGFNVTVLEARSRIGGRVFTDRSSFSVPVDLGASIITGVEADVATERRPDPSSLVCAQLGLELSVLNSDCPLYDIVTGQKVPTDLDEDLEAEYNSLLDDMVLLVAQEGEHAMKMSLEDGLEYALKRRRMVRSGRNYVESELQKLADNLLGYEKFTIDDKIPEDNSSKEILNPLERRVMDWHFANLEYGCAALLKEVSLPYWNQDDVYGGFGGAHCMIKGGYSTVVESLGGGLCIHLNHVVTDVSYCTKDCVTDDDQCNKVKVSTSNGRDFSGDAVLITVPLGCLKAETIKFSPSLPQWKYLSIQRLGFGVLNKVVLEFPNVFWDDTVDYFGATAEETDKRGCCFMFWNVKKTVGAPVLIALVVGKAAIDGQNLSSSDHVIHAVIVLRKLFGDAVVPDPVASVVTDWGRDPYSYGAYSYVAVGASGEDYDILGRPVENCLFFAGEATCKEHPDTVGGAMMSGLREAVRIADILSTGSDYTAEVDAMEAAQRHSDSERSEVRDIIKRLDAVELSNVLYKNSFDGDQILTRESLLQGMFSNAKTTAGRLHLVKELLNLPAEVLKSFAGTKEGLSTLNSWILDSMGKDGTQLLRHCVRLLVLVSTDLLAVRLSGIGKTVKEKVCVHTSRDIRAIASQLVSVWIEIFRKEKASNGGLKLLRQSSALDSSKSKHNLSSGKPPLRMHHGVPDHRGSSKISVSAGNHLPPNANNKKVNVKPVKLETRNDSKSEVKPSRSQGSAGRQDSKGEEDKYFAMSEEAHTAFAAAEAARAAALAAAEAYASSGARCNTSLQLPKIPSFHKFARREQYAQMDESDIKMKWSGGVLGRQDCISEIDSRNCRVRDWSVDFSAAGVNLDSSKMSVDNLSQRSHSNEIACQVNIREHSGESAAVDSSIFTKAWVDSAGSEGIKDYIAIERWQSQAVAADSDFFHRTMDLMDEEDSNMDLKPPTWKHDGLANESSASQVTVNRDLVDNQLRGEEHTGNQPGGVEHIKQAVVDYVASLLMPLYKARKIDKEGYKSIMKKTATKVMEQTTDAEKAMVVFEFLDFKRKNKIRAFVDKLIERHMAMKPGVKS